MFSGGGKGCVKVDVGLQGTGGGNLILGKSVIVRRTVPYT